MRNSRSGSASSSTTTTHDEESFEAIVSVNRSRSHVNEVEQEEEATYQPIKLPTEPTLEELLVRKILRLKFLEI